MSTRFEAGMLCALTEELPYLKSMGLHKGDIVLTKEVDGAHCKVLRIENEVEATHKEVPLSSLQKLKEGDKLHLLKKYTTHLPGTTCTIRQIDTEGAATVTFDDDDASEHMCVLNADGFKSSAYAPFSPEPSPPSPQPPPPTILPQATSGSLAMHLTPNEFLKVTRFMDEFKQLLEQDATDQRITDLLVKYSKEIAQTKKGKLDRTVTAHGNVDGGVNAAVLALANFLRDKCLATDGSAEYPAYCETAKALIRCLNQDAEHISNLNFENAGHMALSLITHNEKLKLIREQHPNKIIHRTKKGANPTTPAELVDPKNHVTKMFASQPSWRCILAIRFYIHISVADRDEANVIDFTAKILTPKLTQSAQYTVTKNKMETLYDLTMTLENSSSAESGSLRMEQINAFDGFGFEPKEYWVTRTNASGANTKEVIDTLMINVLKKVVKAKLEQKPVPPQVITAMNPLFNRNLELALPSDFKFKAEECYLSHNMLTNKSMSGAHDSSPPDAGAPETKVLHEKLVDQFGERMVAGFDTYLVELGESHGFLELLENRQSMIQQGKKDKFVRQKQRFEDLLANFKAQQHSDFNRILDEFPKMKVLENIPHDLILQVLRENAANVLSAYQKHCAWLKQEALNNILRDYFLQHVLGKTKCAQIHGTKRDELNGQFCVLVSLDSDSGRWTVQFDGKPFSLKRDNLNFKDDKKGWEGRLLDTTPLSAAKAFEAKVLASEALQYIQVMKDTFFQIPTPEWTEAEREAQVEIQRCMDEGIEPYGPLVRMVQRVPKLLPAGVTESPPVSLKWDDLFEHLEFGKMIANAQHKAREEEAARKKAQEQEEAARKKAQEQEEAARKKAEKDEAGRKRMREKQEGDDKTNPDNSKKFKVSAQSGDKPDETLTRLEQAKMKVTQLTDQIERKNNLKEQLVQKEDYAQCATLKVEIESLNEQLTAAISAVEAAKHAAATKHERDKLNDQESNQKRLKLDPQIAKLEGRIETLQNELEQERQQKSELAGKVKKLEKDLATVQKTLDSVVGKTMRCMKNAINAMPKGYYGDGVNAIRQCNPRFAQRVHDSIEHEPLDLEESDEGSDEEEEESA